MAVLIEAISVVVRAARLLATFDDDWDVFKRTVRNQTLCADGELVRVGFMTPADAESYVKLLESCGLQYLRDGRGEDIVVVDQLRGPAVPCDWIEFGHISLDAAQRQRVATCRLKGSLLRKILKPEGWTYENSLSCTYGFIPSGSVDKSLRFLRHEGALDVYWNELTGAEVYFGRTGEEPIR